MLGIGARRRHQEILDSLRTLRERLDNVNARVDLLSVPRSVSERSPEESGALATGLTAMANATVELFKHNSELVARMQDRSARAALSGTAADMGRESGRSRRERREQRKNQPEVVADTERDALIKQVSGDCEDCAAMVQNRPPKHTDDMIRHARELHVANRLSPLGFPAN